MFFRTHLLTVRFLLPAACFLLSVCTASAQTADPQTEDGRKQLRTADKQIEFLQKQTLAQSLKMLDEEVFYMFPGVIDGHIQEWGSPDRLEKNCYREYQLDVKRILANRVFRKCLQDLQALPRNKAAEIVIREIQAALVPYQKEYDGYINGCLKSPEATTVLVTISRNGVPALPLFRKKLFALCLLAGTLDLTDAHQTIVQLAELAEKQKAEIKKLPHELVRLSFLTALALSNHQVLAAALYGTYSDKDKLAAFYPRCDERPFVNFETPRIEYDSRFFGEPSAAAKEMIKVRLFDTLTNNDFAELYRLAK
ncbi:MAG: hypothetical protein LBH00_08150 [Planctomycetaceae bacterium]|nr:hypothetical protein [Planctomycetaceae bacterium]